MFRPPDAGQQATCLRGSRQPISIAGNYVAQVDATGGPIVVTFGKKANLAIFNQTLQMSPNTSPGTLRWRCKAGTVNPVNADLSVFMPALIG